MSHGPASEGSSAEPNLVPLLDVVMQLLMFFMMIVQFVNSQINQSIKLPVSQLAVARSKDEADALFINIKAFNPDEFKYLKNKLTPGQYDVFKGWFPDDWSPPPGAVSTQHLCALIVGEPIPHTLDDKNKPLETWLTQQYDKAKRDAQDAQKKEPDKFDGTVKTIVIIRADKDLDYEHVYKVMKLCESVGFSRLKLRALIPERGKS
jgi:biopolymer transport protein ExbD